MAEIRFNLHPAQADIHAHPARFKIVAAGRRFGKTVFSVIRCYEEALATTNAKGIELDNTSEVIYVGIDREQAKRNAWPYFKSFAHEIEKATGLECRILEKTSMIELPSELGGCRIRLLGMDDPDAARGMKLRFAVLDEYADMPPRVWPEIIRPALADVRGGALFIGTPKGRNHFYELVKEAIEDSKQCAEDSAECAWGVFNFSMDDNPFIEAEERADLAKEYTKGSSDLYEQEIQAKFIQSKGQLFALKDFKVIDAVPDGIVDTYLAVDLAGFVNDPNRKNEVTKKDFSAIAVVSIDAAGRWYIRDIQYSKSWSVRETAYRIVSTAREYSIPIIGIEAGVLQQAVEPYMREYMSKYNRWFEIKGLTHGNKNKYDRIQWALQGRVEKGELYLIKGDWNTEFLDQAVSFPSKYVHDDLIDAVAYVDQLAEETLRYDMSDFDYNEFKPTDERAGY